MNLGLEGFAYARFDVDLHYLPSFSFTLNEGPLLGDGLVEAPVAPDLLEVGGIGADVTLHLDRVSREPDQREDDRDQEPQGDQAVERPDQDVPFHGGPRHRPVSDPP